MKTKSYLNVLVYGLVASLAACGSDPAPVVTVPPAAAVPTAPVTLPAPQTAGGDYIRDTIAPWLESYYGRIHLQTQITVMGNGTVLDTIPAGEYGWRDIYDRVVNRLATSCACTYAQVSAYAGASGLSPLASVDYTRFSQFVSQNAVPWQQAAVLLVNGNAVNGNYYGNVGYNQVNPYYNGMNPYYGNTQMQMGGQIYANFAFIFHQLVSMNQTYYTQYYYPVYAGGQMVQPGNWAFGNYYGGTSALQVGASFNSVGGGRGLSLNVNGFFQGLR